MGIIDYKPGNESFFAVEETIKSAYEQVGLAFVFHSCVNTADPQYDVCRSLYCRVLGIPEESGGRVSGFIGDDSTYYVVDHDHIWNGRLHGGRGAITDFVFEVEDDTKLMMLRLILS
jgi:hypothetical protein